MVAYRLVPTLAGKAWKPIAGVIVPDMTVPLAPPSLSTKVPIVVLLT